MGKKSVLQRLRAPFRGKIAVGRQRRPRRSPRRYLDASLGVEKFFSILNDAGVDYVCLRWHEDLPDVRPGEDIDLLIGDAHLDVVAPLLMASKKGGIPVDLYTESGLPGTDYCTVSYFLPELARSALRQPRLHKGLVKIPDPVSHFYTMCYHVVYHKGLASGLPERDAKEGVRAADHDYATAISEMAVAAGLPVPEMTLFGLGEVLERADWKPATDTLRKYARKNPWLPHVIAKANTSYDPDHDGLAVFLIRERARSETPRILEFLEREGFAILETLELDAEHGRRVAARIRGGNWSRGPWPVSGGPPAIAVSAFDCFPRMEQLAENPFEYHNVRIQRARRGFAFC